MPTLHEGDEFAGHRILGIAGRGGMGVVYRALQLDLDRPVALKLIAPQLAEDPDFRDRFVRESRAAASIDHPNVIPIYYTGESDDGALYIAMRYVEGSDLRTLVRAEQRLDPARAAQIVAQVASALDAAHARGIVHRDVKPANVLLGANDHAYLTDFGLTKRVTSHTGSTRDGGWVGTLGYVAPEQIRGERLDARADVYALGCVLYHSLAGVPPYQRESDEATLWAHLNDDPPSLHDRAPDVPASFDAVLARAMAKDPDDRFPSTGDLGRAALAAAGRPVAPTPERLVAIGEAAPGDRQETVVSPDQAPTVLAADAPAQRRLWPWALAAVPIAGLALIAALALGGGDGGGDGSGATTGKSTATGTTKRRQPVAIKSVDRRRAAQQHRPGQRQGVGRAQRQRPAGGDRRQDRQAPVLQPARGQPDRRGRRLRQALGDQPERAVAGADRAEVPPPGGPGGPPASSGHGGRGRRGERVDVGRRPRQPRPAPADRPQEPRAAGQDDRAARRPAEHRRGRRRGVDHRAAREHRHAPGHRQRQPALRSSSARSRSGSPTAAAPCG